MEPIFESNSIRVIETTDSDGEVQRQLYLGPPFNNVQGTIKINRPKFHVHQFTRNLAFGALSVTGGISRALFLGLGAGITIQAARDMYPSAEIDIVEINRDLFEVAHGLFFNIDASNVNLHHEDAYSFLQRAEKKYDYICCDIWSHSLDVPNYLTSGEFSGLAKRLLTDNGIYSINTNRNLLKPLAESLLADFRFVFSLQGNNCLLLATNTWPTFADDPEIIAEQLANNLDVRHVLDTMMLIQPAKLSEQMQRKA